MPALSHRSTREEAGIPIVHEKYRVSVGALLRSRRNEDMDLSRCVVRSRHLEAVVGMKDARESPSSWNQATCPPLTNLTAMELSISVRVQTNRKGHPLI